MIAATRSQSSAAPLVKLAVDEPSVRTIAADLVMVACTGDTTMNDNAPQAISGTAFAWFETGLEGTMWAVQDKAHMSTREDGSAAWSYDGLNVLEDGDQLRLTEKGTGKLLWEGIVDLDREACMTPSPMNPSHSGQAVCNRWVHGLQRGIEPEQWFALFQMEADATLVKAKPTKA